MDNATEQKAIEGLIEYMVDKRFVHGEADVAEFRLYAKAAWSHSDLFVGVSPECIQSWAKYAKAPVKPRRKALIKEKAIDGFIEYVCDSRFVCGKAEDIEYRLYAKAVLASSASFTNELIGTSPEQIKFYVDYANSPVEQRRELLCESIENNTEQVTDIDLRLFFKVLSDIVSGGIRLAELERQLKQLFPPELCDMALKKIIEELALNEVLKIDASTLGLQPGNISGADKRLKFVLEDRMSEKSFDGEGKPTRLYDTDVKAALWECSEGKHLDEFAKAFSSNPTEAFANIRQLMKDSKAIRGIVLRILRKTIGDLPDIADNVRDQRVREDKRFTIIRDESLFDDIDLPPIVVPLLMLVQRTF